MADPITELGPLFASALGRAFGSEYAGTNPAIKPSDFADYQANLALGLKKALGKNPREIATAIVEKLEADDVIEKTEIAGPGFINVTLRNDYLGRLLAKVAAGTDLGITPASPADVVVIDYSSPNAAKEMHVGHLRSTIIGDALSRVLTAAGHRVVPQNHLGDWGTPFGMLIEHLVDVGQGAEQASIGDLNDFYRAAREKFDGDPTFAERSRNRVVMLQGGDAETLRLWKILTDASTAYLDRVYEALGILLRSGDVAGESLFNPMLSDVVDELVKKGLAVEDNGAMCLFVPGYKNRDGEPLPLIVRKKDGGYGYASTDLAAIRYRIQTLHATRLVYVVGTPQSQHLAMLFKAAEMAGWLAPPVRAEHVNFGSVLGDDGKMFKTRAGGTIRLIDLCDEAVEHARATVKEHSPDLDAETAESVARAVGIGAVKYVDLSSDRIKDYVFDWKRMLALDGNTAPYLQYAHARCRSILRKSEQAEFDASAITIEHAAERALAKKLLSFPSVVADVARDLEPHKLCTYLFELATAYSAFHTNCPVLKAETPELKQSRLALVEVSARVLERGLSLLGIEAPPRL
jgi:arginyl-tRNA synthetase